MAKYVLGVDFGTLSGRAVLIDVARGEDVATAAMDYPHAVMDRTLAKTGKRLPPDYALQDPADYLAVLERVIPEVLQKAKADPGDVAGVGVDFTCCTLLSLDKNGAPLCFDKAFEQVPLAYSVLWKHHAAKPYADRLTEVARERGEEFLARCGGKIDEEWTFAKILQIFYEAPELYAATDRFCEAGDWVVAQLTGKLSRSYHFAAYKRHYTEKAGYPSRDFFAAVDPALADVTKKLDGALFKMGSCVGHVTKEAAARFSLAEGTPVAVAMPDGHCAAPGVGVCREGDMFAVLGTSGCFMAVGKSEALVPGICGTVKDGILPGFYGYEAGLSSLGDHFAYAAKNLTSPAYVREAQERGIPMLKLLLEKAAQKKPGESGVIALNWFNGNRSILVDGSLSGCFVGMTLATAPEDLLRALLEATAFGARNIIENFEQHGVEIRRIIACGGIARKDPFTMQLYADVWGREVAVTSTTEGPARGAAICAAVAAGLYPDVADAVERLGAPLHCVYTPNGANFEVYNALYTEYKALHDYFGRGANNVMKHLRALAAKQRGN
ncbi:MAG: ribulokinase [Clostridia bacterium]|nr:ribulokinase [Clostridia bacterium]